MVPYAVSILIAFCFIYPPLQTFLISICGCKSALVDRCFFSVFWIHEFKLVSRALVSWALVSWAKNKTRFVSTRFVSKKKNSFREHSFREQLEKLVSWAISRVSWAKVLTSLLTRLVSGEQWKKYDYSAGNMKNTKNQKNEHKIQ